MRFLTPEPGPESDPLFPVGERSLAVVELHRENHPGQGSTHVPHQSRRDFYMCGPHPAEGLCHATTAGAQTQAQTSDHVPCTAPFEFHMGGAYMR